MSSAQDKDELWLDDDIIELDDDEAVVTKAINPWQVLIVDDEPDIHHATRLALSNIQYKSRPLELLNAYSGAEAARMLLANPRIALILLDVVMETEDAGLRLVHQIRNEMHNSLVRIVLRTGQPGQAPEQRVILDYDINDYKTKTELTVQKLYTTVIASLRSYETLCAIDKSRQGLGKILEGAGDLYICIRCGNLPPACSSRSAPFSMWAPKVPSAPNAGPAHRSWRSWRPPATMNPC
jgi:CheY-like chemotaxis protein